MITVYSFNGNNNILHYGGCVVGLGWPSLLGLWGSGYDSQAGAAFGGLTQARNTIMMISHMVVVY